MKDFDITMTATLRPDLIFKTLTSFHRYLFGSHLKNARLIINIDMVGSTTPESAVNRIIDIIHQFPFRATTIQTCPKSNFAHAWQWCMDQIKSEYFFHLEDDWELIIPMDFGQMMQLMDWNPSLVHLRLSQFKSTEKSLKAWSHHAYRNNQFFEYDDSIKQVDGWAGHPSLNRRDFVNMARALMDIDVNPEKQIKGSWNPKMHDLIQGHRFGIYHPPNTDPAIRDMGRPWMIENGYRKAGSKAWFTQWEDCA